MNMDMAQQRKEAQYQASLEDERTAIAEHNKAMSIKSKFHQAMTKAYGNKDEAHDQMITVIRTQDTVIKECLKRRNELRGLLTQINEGNLANQDDSAIRSELKQIKRELDSAHKAIFRARSQFEVASNLAKDARNHFTRASNKVKHTFKEMKDATRAVRRAEEARVTPKERARIIEIANIPSRFVNSAKVLKGRHSRFEVYYGGADKPDGEGHGHVTVRSNGIVSYHREPEHHTPYDDRSYA